VDPVRGGVADAIFDFGFLIFDWGRDYSRPAFLGRKGGFLILDS